MSSKEDEKTCFGFIKIKLIFSHHRNGCKTFTEEKPEGVIFCLEMAQKLTRRMHSKINLIKKLNRLNILLKYKI